MAIRRRTAHEIKVQKKSRSRRNILNLFHKLLGGIEERKCYFVEKRDDFYCEESENLRNIRESIREALNEFEYDTRRRKA